MLKPSSAASTHFSDCKSNSRRVSASDPEIQIESEWASLLEPNPPLVVLRPAADAEAQRIAWIKQGVCDGLRLEEKYFDDLVQHPVDGPQLKAFLKEEELSAESWLLFYAATELEGADEEEEDANKTVRATHSPNNAW